MSDPRVAHFHVQQKSVRQETRSLCSSRTNESRHTCRVIFLVPVKRGLADCVNNAAPSELETRHSFSNDLRTSAMHLEA